jgi:glycosyltransferase involved in cell wall biosynthesis
MRLADAIIVVSEYWRNILEKAGATDVMVINNSFDLDRFEFTPNELQEFRTKWGFDGQRPVIYLGNARPEKGYLEAFEALNGIDATFVATGKSETPEGIHRLFLGYTDYLRLLKISSVVLTMSKFDEGWCRTAHEAMLCGTPVIGSGRGGMGELLLKGGQIICRDFSSLRPALLELLSDKENMKGMGAEGREFAQKFSLGYFKGNWNDLIENILSSPPKIGVLHLTHTIAPYGIGNFLLHLLGAHRRRPGVCTVLGYSTGSEFERRFREAKIPLLRLPAISARDFLLFFSCLFHFRRFELIAFHTNSPWAFLAAAFLRKKIIYVFHGAFGFRGGPLDFVKKRFYSWVVHPFSDFMIFASQTSLSIYRDRIGHLPTEKKIALFPFGLQIESINSKVARNLIREELGLSDEFIIGTAARIDRVKRIERIIQAFSFLPDKKSFRLLIVGDGDKAYLNELLALVRKEKLGDYVRFMGFRADAVDIINALDFFVLPSRNETFGLALLEAMALGVPCAVFGDAGGARDIIGDAGFVVDTPAQLSEIIVKLKNGQYEKDLISLDLKRRAKELDIEGTVDRFYRYYKKLVRS